MGCVWTMRLVKKLGLHFHPIGGAAETVLGRSSRSLSTLGIEKVGSTTRAATDTEQCHCQIFPVGDMNGSACKFHRGLEHTSKAASILVEAGLKLQ